MKRVIVPAIVVGLVAAVAADEGMWTFDNFPRAAVAEKYRVQITDDWLRRLQQSVVRLETGCTGSFVSSEGLVLTNHHCIASCLADNSSPTNDLVARGHISEARQDEVRCQGSQASVLMATENVTDKVTGAVAAAPAAEAAAARNRALTTLESECIDSGKQSGSPLQCEVVTLYQGGQYWLYKYKRYDDVRLVFAPEADIAAFGGDPDNFQFPRWCLDMSLLRVYENGQPAKTPEFLRFNWGGANPGDPVFVAGHPGTTQRLLTVAQLKTQRDLVLPFWLLRFSELRGRMAQYAKTSEEAARQAKDYFDSIENAHKVRRGQLFALLDERMMEQQLEQERTLRAAVEANPALRARAGSAWDDIARAEQRYRDILMPYTWLEGGAAFNSQLFVYARTLVRAADERAKPNATRLREFTEAALPQLRQSLEAASPVYPEFEIVRLSFSLERMREYLGPDHTIVRAVLGNASPDVRARQLVEESRLSDPQVRKTLFEGGPAAVTASNDPMLALARLVDAESRRLRTIFENEVQAPQRAAQQAIAEARFAALGSQVYPDATFTLRLSYGAVQGWTEGEATVEPYTQLERLYARATGQRPFALPRAWLDARSRINTSARANFVATTDIVGGNSGSPMVNAAGEIVGLVFDGNIHSTAGSYWFDPAKNRTVAVHPQFMRTALLQVYPARAVAEELGLPRP